MLFLCAAYVFGCAFRSFLPRADVQRICLFDTWLSSVVIGRSVATVAEICFAAQWAIVLRQLGGMARSGHHLERRRGDRAADRRGAVLLVVRGVDDQLSGQCHRKFDMGGRLPGGWDRLCRLLPEFQGLVRLGIVVAIIGIAGYLAFLITIDVPMYLSRWQDGLADGSKVLSPLEGLRDASTRWVVTHDFAQWKDEIAWMSLYFTAAVWASLALCLVSCLEGGVSRYRIEPAAEALSIERRQHATIEAREPNRPALDR